MSPGASMRILCSSLWVVPSTSRCVSAQSGSELHWTPPCPPCPPFPPGVVWLPTPSYAKASPCLECPLSSIPPVQIIPIFVQILFLLEPCLKVPKMTLALYLSVYVLLAFCTGLSGSVPVSALPCFQDPPVFSLPAPHSELLSQSHQTLRRTVNTLACLLPMYFWTHPSCPWEKRVLLSFIWLKPVFLQVQLKHHFSRKPFLVLILRCPFPTPPRSIRHTPPPRGVRGSGIA